MLWGPVHKGFMSLYSRSCKNLCCSYLKNTDPIRSQFCTCPDSWAVVTWANLWPDWIIKIIIIDSRFLINSLQNGSCPSVVNWSRCWLGAIRQQAWTNVDQDPWHHTNVTPMSQCVNHSEVWMHRQIFNVRCTKSQNSNVSLLLQLSFPNPLKPSIKLRMKM